MTLCDGRARKTAFGKFKQCVTQKQEDKLPAALVKGLIKYRAKEKAAANKRSK